ncbi:MAG TPA: hypothetical protein VFS21_37520 [Roseiflexaceae bacterium]|nr:hypothetical protein [Roseiflexaceae bacterium]
MPQRRKHAPHNYPAPKTPAELGRLRQMLADDLTLGRWFVDWRSDGISLNQIARDTGFSRPAVRQRIILAEADPAVQQAFIDGLITFSVIRRIGSILGDDPEGQQIVLGRLLALSQTQQTITELQAEEIARQVQQERQHDSNPPSET